MSYISLGCFFPLLAVDLWDGLFDSRRQGDYKTHLRGMPRPGCRRKPQQVMEEVQRGVSVCVWCQKQFNVKRPELHVR